MRARIVALNDLKLSVNEIALSLRITERTVWRHLSRQRASTKTTKSRMRIPA
jgi:DNA-binding CsgD family transcriptional regulator